MDDFKTKHEHFGHLSEFFAKYWRPKMGAVVSYLHEKGHDVDALRRLGVELRSNEEYKTFSKSSSESTLKESYSHFDENETSEDIMETINWDGMI